MRVARARAGHAMRLLWPPLGGRAYTHSHVAGTSRTSVSITQSTILVASLCHVSMRPAAKDERAGVCLFRLDSLPHSLVHTRAQAAASKACVSVRARGEGCRFITMADDEPPALQAASSSEAGILTPRSGQELAASAGRSVDAFNVILMSQATESEGRQVVLEVADHGISMRDPYGALLKVVPLEYITGWKSDAQTLVLMISKDLETFYRMRCQTNDGPAIEAALTKAAKVSAPHLAKPACRHPQPRAAAPSCRAGARGQPAAVDAAAPLAPGHVDLCVQVATLDRRQPRLLHPEERGRAVSERGQCERGARRWHERAATACRAHDERGRRGSLDVGVGGA